MIKLFIVDVEEFAPVLKAARSLQGARVAGPFMGYYLVEADSELHFYRRAMGFKPALWWSMLTGGFRGRISTYTREELRISPERDFN